MKSQINLDTNSRFVDVTINGVSVAPLFAKSLVIVLEAGKPPRYTISNEDDCEMVNGMSCGGGLGEA